MKKGKFLKGLLFAFSLLITMFVAPNFVAAEEVGESKAYILDSHQYLVVENETDLELSWLHEMLKEDKVIGIGEIGIDLYYSKEYKDLQIEFFKKQLEMSLQYNLPVSIHTRDAIELTYNILSEKKYNGIVHCYSGSLEMARKFIDKGYYLGIGGVVTFKNTNLKEVVKNIPLTSIVTETDAPYLAPTPYRGKLNKPEYIKLIVEEIANLHNVKIEVVEEIIDQNVNSLFNL